MRVVQRVGDVRADLRYECRWKGPAAALFPSSPHPLTEKVDASTMPISTLGEVRVTSCTRVLASLTKSFRTGPRPAGKDMLTTRALEAQGAQPSPQTREMPTRGANCRAGTCRGTGSRASE